jgi:beta-phosphoglucomutase
MSWLAPFSLFVFDFDGLLVNTEDLHFAAYIEMCRRHGHDLTWDFKRFCKAAHYSSSGLREGIYEEFPDLKTAEPDWMVLYAEKKAIYQDFIEQGKVELLPGVASLLIRLEEQGIGRCVATNSTRKQVETIKKHLPLLQTIPHWTTREDYVLGKPEPDAYLTALKAFDQELVPIGFEDSLRGIRALQGAGIKPVLVCSGDHPQMDEPLLQGVLHFSSLEGVLASS